MAIYFFSNLATVLAHKLPYSNRILTPLKWSSHEVRTFCDFGTFKLKRKITKKSKSRVTISRIA